MQKKKTDKKLDNLTIFFVAALAETDIRKTVVDDAEKRFKDDLKKFGYRWAKCMVWRDSLVIFWNAVGVKIIKGLRLFGVGYFLMEIIKSFIK